MALKSEGLAFSYTAGVGFDFRDILTSIVQSVPASGGATWSMWETNPWDTQPWGSEGATINRWSGGLGEGYCASLAVSMTLSTQRIEWLASTYLLEAARGI